MNFADLKNDSIFRRIFATNPSLLQELLNDLLERTGDQTIEGIEYLPKGQLPLVAGAKLSILDVLCRDRTGAYFVVEIQLIHMAGFIHRVTYRGYKAEADQPEAGETDARLMDVVVISICDFELWPDAEQDDRKRIMRIDYLPWDEEVTVLCQELMEVRGYTDPASNPIVL